MYLCTSYTESFHHLVIYNHTCLVIDRNIGVNLKRYFALYCMVFLQKLVNYVKNFELYICRPVTSQAADSEGMTAVLSVLICAVTTLLIATSLSPRSAFCFNFSL